MQTTIYLKAEGRVEVTTPRVTIEMIGEVESGDKEMKEKIEKLTLAVFKENKHERVVVSILKIYEMIHKVYPNIKIENLGACDIVIIYEKEKISSKKLQVLKAVLVSIVTFIGAAYSIMAFSNDVDTLEIFDLIYQLIVGESPTGFTVLEASYSIGLVLGIVIFFNHFGKKKLTEDPTPMEVEMRLYEQDIQTTLVQDYSRKGEEINVD